MAHGLPFFPEQKSKTISYGCDLKPTWMDHTNLGHSKCYGCTWSEGLSGDSAHQTEDPWDHQCSMILHFTSADECERCITSLSGNLGWFHPSHYFVTLSFFTFVFLVPLTWGDLLEAVVLALGESVLLPLTWGQLIGGNSSGHYPKVLVAELAKPKPPLIAAKAPWTGVALPPAPTSSFVACLYLWICLPFFALYSKFPCGSLCLCLSCVLACGKLPILWF